MAGQGSRLLAPQPLELVQAFINTADLEQQSDEVRTPQALGEWLRARKLLGRSEALSKADHRQAIQLRELLRRAARANNGEAIDARTLRQLNELAQGTAFSLDFRPGGTVRLQAPREGFDAAVGEILAAVGTSMMTGKWVRLKSCASDGCQWAFYDWSKNRSGRWCDMAECGNDAKGRAFRARRRSVS